MSRHRSPAGRRAHPWTAPQAAPLPGAQPRPSADAPRSSGAAVALLERPRGADEWDSRPLGAYESPTRRAADAAPRPVPPLPPAPRPVVRTAPAVRNGLVAAAATAGVLSTIAPLVALLPASPGTPGAAASLTLAADTAAAEPVVSEPAVAGPPAAPAPLLAGSLVPVTATQAALPPEMDAAGLLKAVGLEDVARQAEEARLAREAAARCDADLGGLGRVKPWVRDAAQFLSCLYEQPDVLGVGQRARASDHPRGLAVDLMTRGERGDRIAECALANQEALGISYVIWQQRVNYGDGWERMSDRGGDTANHMDHVHVSFERGAGSGDPVAALCT